MLSLQAIEQFLQQHPQLNQLWVAYSGGLDSQALLHRLADLLSQIESEVTLRAIHVHHGLQRQADEWEAHCVSTCRQWQIPLQIHHVALKPMKGESIEEAARVARYRIFEKYIGEHACLVTAHHEDDQAETLLLQLVRGAGVHGLAAMPELAPFGKGILWRPLLNTARADIEQYAKQHRLTWVEDPSNQDIRFDRNFLRLHIFSLLKQRWPHINRTLHRSARHCAEAAHCISERARELLTQCRGSQPNSLQISSLMQLSAQWRKMVLREWLYQFAGCLPSQNQLQRIQQEVIASRLDANPLVVVGEQQIRRYRGELFIWQPLPDDFLKKEYTWDLQQDMDLFPFRLRLTAKRAIGKGIDPFMITLPLRIQFRQGGERCQPAGRIGSHPLKKLMQEWQIPPWLRPYIPILYEGEKIVAVTGYCVTQEYVVSQDQEGIIVDMNWY